jgi:hypothetical protein
MNFKCSWPGCPTQSDRPFADGWCVYDGNYQDLVPGLPNSPAFRMKADYAQLITARSMRLKKEG